MFGSTMLELAIGLVFFYLLLGLICSVIVEFISSKLDLRARYLELGIQTLLRDPMLSEQFFNQPLIRSLTINRRLPSYIPPRSFALSIMTLVMSSSSEHATIKDIRDIVYSWTSEGATGSLRKVLMVMEEEAPGDTERLRAGLESWFASTMDQIASLYKRRIQWMLFAIALIITVAANVNTFTLARHTSETSILREVLASGQMAGENSYGSTAVGVPTPTPRLSPSPSPIPSATFNPGGTPGSSFTPMSSPTPVQEIDVPNRSLERKFTPLDANIVSAGFPIGWTPYTRSLLTGGNLQWLNLAVGWLITALAATVCALFWFDVLSRFIVVRTAIKPAAASQPVSDEPSNPSAGSTM